jgi:hypothetical protein
VWKKMTGNQSGQTEPGSDLPGFENVYGNKPDKPSPGIEAKPRLIPADLLKVGMEALWACLAYNVRQCKRVK